MAGRIAHLHKLCLPFGQRRSCQHAQYPADGKLEADITRGKRLLHPNDDGGQRQRGKGIRRLEQKAAHQHDEEHNARTEHRERQPCQPHIEQQNRDLQQDPRNREPAAPSLPHGKQAAQQRHMQAGNRQQVGNARRAEGITPFVRQFAFLAQQHGSFHPGKILWQVGG